MQATSDVAVLGTGVAPLVAASHLLASDVSVSVLNPNWDFFLEESELPLDPLWPLSPEVLGIRRLSQSLPKKVLEELRPDFPGAVEFWDFSGPVKNEKGFHDFEAPHVRDRSRLWVRTDWSFGEGSAARNWDAVENMYLEVSDAGLHPEVVEGPLVGKYFPGFSKKERSTNFWEGLKGVLVPHTADVDLRRYREGLMEYLQERLGPERFLKNISQLEVTSDGVRYYSGGHTRSLTLKKGLLVFWTPALTSWLETQVFSKQKKKSSDLEKIFPKGIRSWEEWSIVSRDVLDPGTLGVLDDMIVWADVLGASKSGNDEFNQLNVLKAGPLIPFQRSEGVTYGQDWVTSSSLNSLSSLCHEFLGWDYFSVRSMVPRSLFEWGGGRLDPVQFENVMIIPGSDGPLNRVVHSARKVARRFL